MIFLKETVKRLDLNDKPNGTVIRTVVSSLASLGENKSYTTHNGSDIYLSVYRTISYTTDTNTYTKEHCINCF